MWCTNKFCTSKCIMYSVVLCNISLLFELHLWRCIAIKRAWWFLSKKTVFVLYYIPHFALSFLVLHMYTTLPSTISTGLKTQLLLPSIISTSLKTQLVLPSIISTSLKTQLVTLVHYLYEFKDTTSSPVHYLYEFKDTTSYTCTLSLRV